MRKTLVVLALSSLLVACSSSDYDDRPQRRGRSPVNGEGGYGAARFAGGGLDMMPPPDWWHEPSISNVVNLTPDQYAALDKIGADQRDEVSRMERDSTMGTRDLRQVLDSSQPSTNDIMASAQRLRALRDNLFDRQMQMLAAERQVLSQQQWQNLQQQLHSERSQQRDNGYQRRGGRGMGGRGRWPGF